MLRKYLELFVTKKHNDEENMGLKVIFYNIKK
jgi:hypothetical protein